MHKLKKHNTGFSTTQVAVVLMIVVLIGAIGWFIFKNHQMTSTSTTSRNQATSSNARTNLTNSQIFKEVSTQLHLSKNALVYFRIFGQDKVQYSSAATGNTYAYKISGTWKIAATGVQGVVLCNTLSSVPEQYRPPCSRDSSDSTVSYEETDGTSSNYPPSKAVSYIGQ